MIIFFKIFLSFSNGVVYLIFSSFVLAQSMRIEEAWFLPSRKRIKNKWRYILRTRSECDICKKKLPIVFLIPVMGNFLARYFCNDCQKKLSYQYVFVEIIAFFYGILIAWFYLLKINRNYFFSNLFLLEFFVFMFLEMVFVSLLFHAARLDKKYMLVADENLIMLFIVAFLKLLANSFLNFLENHRLYLSLELYNISLIFFWSFVWFIILSVLQRIFSNKLGLADVRLIPILILAAGLPVGMFIPLVASIFALVWIMLNNGLSKNTLQKKEIAFVPFLFFAWLFLALWQGFLGFSLYEI